MRVDIKTVKAGERVIESLIKKNFSREFMKKIYDVYSNKNMAIVEKTIAFDKLFNEEFGDRKDYRRIGEGTNRFVCLLDNHIIKVAYNYLAYIDNMNELAMAKVLPRNIGLALAYETNGLILVSEYVTVMDKEDFMESQTQIKAQLMLLEKQILNKVNKTKNLYYILGDMGMSSKNYGNWGRRTNGDIVVLDYGYLYQVSYENWRKINRCPLCGSSLEYTDDYTELKCVNENCDNNVKYTTLRNYLGYKKIIDNIKENLNKDEYVKFDEEGKITVDVYEDIEIEIEEEELRLPEEIEQQLEATKNKFNDIIYCIKHRGEFNLFKQSNIIDELLENKDNYYEPLLPMLMTSVKLNQYNFSKYVNDFNIQYNDLYELLMESVKQEHVRESIVDEDQLYDEMMSEIYDENIGYDENNNRTDYDKLNSLIDEDADDIIMSSLEERLGQEFGTKIININDIDDKMDDINDDFSMDDILSYMSSFENNNTDKEEDNDKNQINKELKGAFDKIKSSLMSIIREYINDEDGFVEGDVYHTLLNGEYIEYEYSAEVNAQNILGNWKPEEFAFPLYRHLLVIKQYDSEDTLSEYEARYKIGSEVPKIPNDIYDDDENVEVVIEQILTRFGECDLPIKPKMRMEMSKPLKEYYKLLDNYYDTVQEGAIVVGLDNNNYYYEKAVTNTELMKELQEAYDDLCDELLDENKNINEELKKGKKIIYYYDCEDLYSIKELNMLDLIKEMNFINKDGTIKDIETELKNKYYKTFGCTISDSVFDVFKYAQSLVLETGYKRIRRPLLKAKLVPENVEIDTLKPVVFNKNDYVVIRIEQRYEVMIKNNKDSLPDIQDIKSNLNKRNLYYTISDKEVYTIKRTKDCMRYLMSEKEYELLSRYEEMYGISDIKDKNKLYAKTIVDMLNKEYHMCDETYKLFNNIATKGLNEALSQRSLIINVLELSGNMSRLEYLNSVE